MWWVAHGLFYGMIFLVIGLFMLAALFVVLFMLIALL